MKQAPLIILGAGALGRISLEIARAADVDVAGFLDDTIDVGTAIDSTSVLGGFSFIEKEDASTYSFTVAIAQHHELREALVQKIAQHKGRFATLIHPSADVSPFAKVGKGVSIANFVKVHSGACIGDFCFVEDQSSVGIDTDIGAHSLITTGVKLNGRCKCGPRTFFGSNSTIGPGVTIGSDVVVGAGATILKPLKDGAKVMAPTPRAFF